jgi:hypothetical protein
MGDLPDIFDVNLAVAHAKMVRPGTGEAKDIGSE